MAKAKAATAPEGPKEHVAGTMLKGPSGHIAIRTGPTVTAGDWFVFHPDHGGGYTDGKAQKVDDWVPMIKEGGS